jgi:hypothetical protein
MNYRYLYLSVCQQFLRVVGVPIRMFHSRTAKVFLIKIGIYSVTGGHSGIVVLNFLQPIIKRQDSAVGTATGYGLDDQGVGVRVAVWARIFTSPCLPDRLWGQPSLLSNGYRRIFLRE